MNPHFGHFPTDPFPERPRDLSVPLNRQALDRWRELRSLARVPGERPPRDQAQWLAWANGERTTGPRWESLDAAELRARQVERRTRPEVAPPPLGLVSPWSPSWWGVSYVPGRFAIKNGRQHRSPVVRVVPTYRNWYRADWSAWRIDGLEAVPCEGQTEAAVCAMVDAALRAQRVEGV